MELRQIQYFIQLYQDLNITRASKHLYISQQGLSKSVSRLEEELGFPLFERRTSGVIPTREADILFRHCSKIANAYHELQLAIDNLRQNRVLKIAAYHGFALSNSKDLLSGYRSLYPQSEIRYQEKWNHDLPEHLLCQQADLAFMRGPLPRTLTSVHLLYREPAYLIMDSRHPLASRRSVLLRELHNQNLLFLDDMNEVNETIRKQTSRQGAVCRSQSIAGINEFLHTLYGSQLIGIGSRRMYQYHQFPEIHFVPFAPGEYEKYPELMLETHLAIPSGMTPDAVTQQFIDYIVQKTQPEEPNP